MTVSELIAELSKMDPLKKVLAGYPIVRESGDMESLCGLERVSSVSLHGDGWETGEFVLIEIMPPFALTC